MNLFPEYLLMNGRAVAVKRFYKGENQIKQEAELAGFLKDWYSDKPFITVQTSGSTGPPRHIKLEKKFIAQSAFRTIQYFNLHQNDRILLCLPIKFIAGKLMVIRALVGNLDITSVAPSTDFSFLQNEKFRFAAMIPHQVLKLLDTEPHPGSWMNNIDQLLIGGSAIPTTLENRLQEISTACYSSYAMTETATHIALRKINGPEADAYYHCLNDISVLKSENGCLEISMPGLKNQTLVTTDLAEVIDEKTFRIIGRSDNVIISGGIKYLPEILEKKLEPFIRQPFLFTSLPHTSLGQQLVLVIENNEGSLNEAHYFKICQAHLDKYELPRQIKIIDKIPITSTGKPDRKAIF